MKYIGRTPRQLGHCLGLRVYNFEHRSHKLRGFKGKDWMVNRFDEAEHQLKHMVLHSIFHPRKAKCFPSIADNDCKHLNREIKKWILNAQIVENMTPIT